jgi:nucleotide-binding universal stress UspA family protein
VAEVSVAVAHQIRTTSRTALREAAREAGFRGTELVVIHVSESLDQDLAEAYKAGVSDEIERALGAPEVTGLHWTLHLDPGGSDIATTILQQAVKADAELLVIGGRRRSAVGKALMGSTTQKVILGATMPVLVVMPDE